MPSLVIHIAIANEYIRKNKFEIRNKEQFIKGVIAPDLTDDKIKSHYYAHSYLDPINLKEFLQNNDIKNNDFNKGYFLHLISDEIFYRIVYRKEYMYVYQNDLSFYDDYYYLNKKIIRKYKISTIPNEIVELAEYREGKTKYLKYNKIKRYINKITNIRLKDYIQQIFDVKNTI